MSHAQSRAYSLRIVLSSELEEQLQEMPASGPILRAMLNPEDAPKMIEDLRLLEAKACYAQLQIYTQAGQTPLVLQNRQRILELGFDLDEPEVGKQLRPPHNTLQQLQNLSQIPNLLDTRGFLLYRLDRPNEALPDLTEAALIKTAELRAIGKDPDLPKLHIDIRELHRDLYSQQHVVAVIRYHLALVCQAMGNEESAQDQLDAVQALGFTPSEDLR